MLNFMHLAGQKRPRPIEGLIYHLKLDGTPGAERDLVRNMEVVKHYGNVTKSTDVPSAQFKGSYYFDGSSWVQSKCDDFLYDNLLQSPTYSASYWFRQYGNSPSGHGWTNSHLGIGTATEIHDGHQQLFQLYSNPKYFGLKKFMWEPNGVTSKYKPDTNLLTAEIIEFNRWYHAVITFDRVHGGRVYINNSLVAQAGPAPTGADWNRTANNIIRVGRAAYFDIYTGNSWGWREPFYGCICDFRVYSTELQPAEIAALYANAA